MENERERKQIALRHVRTWAEHIGAQNRRQVDRLQRCAIDRVRPLLILLIGAFGSGKTRLAEFFSQAYRCQHRTADSNPCNTCEDCTRPVPECNGNGVTFQQYQFDCHRIITRAKLLPILEDLEAAPQPVVFFDQLEGLTKRALKAMLSFLDHFHGVFIAAIATDELEEMKRARTIPPALFERFRKVYLYLPEIEEIIAFLKLQAPEWGANADEEMLRLMVTAASGSFRSCLEILQAAQENDPPVLDCATIEEFLQLPENSKKSGANSLPDEDYEDDEEEW